MTTDKMSTSKMTIDDMTRGRKFVNDETNQSKNLFVRIHTISYEPLTTVLTLIKPYREILSKLCQVKEQPLVLFCS